MSGCYQQLISVTTQLAGHHFVGNLHHSLFAVLEGIHNSHCAYKSVCVCVCVWCVCVCVCVCVVYMCGVCVCASCKQVFFIVHAISVQ